MPLLGKGSRSLPGAFPTSAHSSLTQKAQPGESTEVRPQGRGLAAEVRRGPRLEYCSAMEGNEVTAQGQAELEKHGAEQTKPGAADYRWQAFLSVALSKKAAG